MTAVRQPGRAEFRVLGPATCLATGHCGADPLGARLLGQLLTAVEADRRWWVRYADGGQVAGCWTAGKP